MNTLVAPANSDPHVSSLEPADPNAVTWQEVHELGLDPAPEGLDEDDGVTTK